MSEQRDVNSDRLDDVEQRVMAAKPRGGDAVDRDHLMFLAGQASAEKVSRESSSALTKLRCWQLATIAASLLAMASTLMVRGESQRRRTLEVALRQQTERLDSLLGPVVTPPRKLPEGDVSIAMESARPEVMSAFHMRQVAATNDWHALASDQPHLKAVAPINYWNASRRLVESQSSPIRGPFDLWN